MKKEGVIKKIESLEKREKDELFFKCGWKDSDKGKNKALPDFRINEIKKGEEKELINTLIQKTENIEEILGD